MSDSVLAELDAEERRLLADLERIRDFKAWWTSRRHEPKTAPKPPSTGALTRRLVANHANGSKTVREWIIDALNEHVSLAPPQIRDFALAAGWQTDSQHPGVVVRNTLAAMEQKGEVVKEDDGTWSLREPQHTFVRSIHEGGGIG